MTQWGLDTLFNPSKRHMDEEKRRLQATRQQVGDTSGGKRIDLESGKVRIAKSESDEEAAEEATEQTAEAAGDGADGDTAEADGHRDSAEQRRELTPAQIRAAKRRGRTPR
jgi:hypothetical protein